MENILLCINMMVLSVQDIMYKSLNVIILIILTITAVIYTAFNFNFSLPEIIAGICFVGALFGVSITFKCIGIGDVIVTLILFGMRWHDELVVDSIKLQVALKLEQENISDKNEKYNEIIKNAADNARSRLLIKETDMNEITSGINDYIKLNSQSDFIRKTNALLKLKE